MTWVINPAVGCRYFPRPAVTPATLNRTATDFAAWWTEADGCEQFADTSWGRLAQLITFCQEQELDLGNEVSPTVAQPPRTLFLPTSTTLPTPVHSENDSRVYFVIVLTTDHCWRSWTCRIARPTNFTLIDWLMIWYDVSARPDCDSAYVFYAWGCCTSPPNPSQVWSDCLRLWCVEFCWLARHSQVTNAARSKLDVLERRLISAVEMGSSNNITVRLESICVGWPWRNFVPYLCPLIFAAIL